MSDQQPTSVDPAREERRKSIGKYVKRLGSVLRRDSSKKSSSSPSSDSAKASSAAITSTASPSVAKTPESTVPAPAPAPVEQKPAVALTGSGSFSRGAIQEERARALFAKYGLTLEAHEWVAIGASAAAAVNVQRVERPIRMRVHRTCHRCNGFFNSAKNCPKCDHKRCQKCPRYPIKKKAKEPAAAAAAAAAANSQVRAKPVAGTGRVSFDPTLLYTTSGKSIQNRIAIRTRDGQERVFDQPKHRIRRTCHKCDTSFIPPTQTTCSNCSHTRCTACPREPAKTKKYPNGYPGDVPAEADEPVAQKTVYPVRDRAWKKPRRRVRHFCHECEQMFMGIESKTCDGCQHERCDKCPRDPPKKPKQEFDPAVIKSVEDKLANVAISDTSNTTKPVASGLSSTLSALTGSKS